MNAKVWRNAIHLCNHHMAIKRPLPIRTLRPLNPLPDLLHHRRSKGEVGYKMAVHDIHMEPVGAMPYGGYAGISECCEICRQD